jgi:glycine/D-amino acid oxidase-like deaminating enzyme
MRTEYDAVIVGGGFFGCMTALELRRRCRHVVLLEQGEDLLLRASYHNQARVHHGYHYPRSLRTALRSRINFPRFVRQFEFCIERSFDKYYGVARQFSKVTARQFRSFFEHIQAPIERAPASVRRLFNSDLVEEVFRVTEYVFDAVRLRNWLRQRLLESDVEIHFRTEAVQVRPSVGGRLLLTMDTPEGRTELLTREAFNCTYAQVNRLLAGSGLPLIPLKQELTEMALVQVPEPLTHLGITLMCGPFFSLMPFPARGLHSLSHVRYTPHAAWTEGDGAYRPAYAEMAERPQTSHYTWMVRDAARYLPMLAACRYEDSLWEVKTVLPRSEVDDSRPILFKRDHGLANLHCVLGAKIDNVFDLLDELEQVPRQGRRSA